MHPGMMPFGEHGALLCHPDHCSAWSPEPSRQTRQGNSQMGRQSPMLTLGLGGACQRIHGLPEKTIDRRLVIPKEPGRELNINPTLALLSLYSLCKLSCLPGKWVCNAFSKQERQWLRGKREFSCLSGHASLLAQWETSLSSLTSLSMIMTLGFLAGTQETCNLQFFWPYHLLVMPSSANHLTSLSCKYFASWNCPYDSSNTQRSRIKDVCLLLWAFIHLVILWMWRPGLLAVPSPQINIYKSCPAPPRGFVLPSARCGQAI